MMIVDLIDGEDFRQRLTSLGVRIPEEACPETCARLAAGCHRAKDVEGELLGWKALIALDALLFFDLKGGESVSRKALVADRIRMCEQGHWGTLWTHAEMQSSADPI